MFKLIKKYESVNLKGFCKNAEFLLRGDGNISRIDLESLSVTEAFDFEDFTGFTEYSKNLIIQDFSNVYLVEKGKVTLARANCNMLSDLFDDEYIILDHSQVLDGSSYKFNVITKELIWSGVSAVKTFRVPEGLLYLTRERIPFSQIIKLIDVQTGKVQWSIDVSEIAKQERNGKVTDGQVIDYLGVHDGLLWFSLTDYKVIAVDPALGEIVHMVEGLPDQYRLRIDPWRKSMVGMRRKLMWEIPLKTREVLTYDLSETLKEDDINAIDFSSGPDYYYFADAYTGFIGALDKNTLQVVWKFRIEEVDFHNIGTQLSGIYFRSDTLLITDLQGNLFIMKPT